MYKQKIKTVVLTLNESIKTTFSTRKISFIYAGDIVNE